MEQEVIEGNKIKEFFSNLGSNLLLICCVGVFAIVVSVGIAALFGLIYLIYIVCTTVSILAGIAILIGSIIVAAVIGTIIKGSWL